MNKTQLKFTYQQVFMAKDEANTWINTNQNKISTFYSRKNVRLEQESNQ